MPRSRRRFLTFAAASSVAAFAAAHNGHQTFSAPENRSLINERVTSPSEAIYAGDPTQVKLAFGQKDISPIPVDLLPPADSSAWSQTWQY